MVHFSGTDDNFLTRQKNNISAGHKVPKDAERCKKAEDRIETDDIYPDGGAEDHREGSGRSPVVNPSIQKRSRDRDCARSEQFGTEICSVSRCSDQESVQKTSTDRHEEKIKMDQMPQGERKKERKIVKRFCADGLMTEDRQEWTKELHRHCRAIYDDPEETNEAPMERVAEYRRKGRAGYRRRLRMP